MSADDDCSKDGTSQAGVPCERCQEPISEDNYIEHDYAGDHDEDDHGCRQDDADHDLDGPDAELEDEGYEIETSSDFLDGPSMLFHCFNVQYKKDPRTLNKYVLEIEYWPDEQWHAFLEWLGERWWGLVSEKQITSYMNTRKNTSNTGDAVVITSCLDDTPGGLCSVTIKPKNGQLVRFETVHRGSSYACTHLSKVDFQVLSMR